MDTVSKNGLMELSMKASTKMERSMEMGSLRSLILALTQVNFKIMKFQAWENMSGQMEKCMKVNGTKIKCTDKVSLSGGMENATKANF
jgi:hypothetical protein